MSSARVIPESLHVVLFELYGEHDARLARRRTYRDLSTWLLETHGISASHTAIRRVVEPLRRERAELRRDALRERLTAQLASQVDTLDDLMVKVAALVTSSGKKKPSPSTVLDALDMYRRAVETKARFSGVGESVKVDLEGELVTDDAQTSDARRELAEALAREAALARRRGASGGSGGSDSSGGDGAPP